MRASATILCLGLMLSCGFAAEPPSGEDAVDVDLLKEHGVPVDARGLPQFLRDRTLDDRRIERVRLLIEQMGHTRFAVRDQAAKELARIGVPGLKYLDEARKHSDPEIAERASRIAESIRSGPGASLPIAALRQIAARNDREALPVILAYLPFADDPTVEEAALNTLLRLGVHADKADERFHAALASDEVRLRSAAGFVLGRSPSREDQAAAVKLLGDKDPWVRLRTAEGLVRTNGNAVAVLIGLLNPEVDDLTWRAEQILVQIAGENTPAPPVESGSGGRKAYQTAWTTWWEKNRDQIDLAKVAAEPPLLGLFVGIEYNTNSVYECGRDGKRRWTITADGPMDAQVLPGNRVLIAEQTAKRVTERDLKGNILWEFGTPNEETLNCRRLPNGNTWIGTRYSSMEVRPDKKVVYSHRMSDQYLHSIRRLPDGRALGLTSDGLIIEKNPAGKLVRSVKAAHEGTWGDADLLPNGNYLISNYGAGFVREIDREGKTIREIKVPDACGVNLLKNGQLIVSGGSFALITDWTGQPRWQMQSAGCVRRIHMR